MKRYLFLIATIPALLFQPLWAKSSKTEAKQPFHPFTGKVIGNKVRLRLQPNLEGHILRELTKGEIFAVVDENHDYFAVAPKEDITAYVFRTHVLDGQVEGSNVNVRLAPNTEAPIIAQLNSGDKVTVLNQKAKGKWLKIQLPQTAYLWVAKDYIHEIGPVEYAAKYQERINEASQLLATANLISQAEFRKSFKEIDLNRITRNYERVLSDYTDLDDIHVEAKKAIQTIQKEYCDRKIAFLENKAGKAALEVKALNAKLTNLNTDMTTISSDKTSSPFASILNHGSPTDKMKVWQPIEYAMYQTWAYTEGKKEATLQEFYDQEVISSKLATGIIDTFNKVVKSKPGDYTLLQNGQTIAYLYSTHVNLDDYIGKEVTLKVTERDNRSFAFPAYYVLDLKEE